jgi:hypothetical protein
MIRKHLRLKKVLLGLAFALVAAPTAQAYTGLIVDGPTTGIQSRTDARHAALLTKHAALTPQPVASEISVQPKPLSQLQIQAMRLDAMAAAYQSKSPVRSENSFGVPGPSVGGAQGPVSVATVSTAGSNGFNWDDAGIGASVAFGAALLLLLSVALGRRYYTRSDGSNLAST